MRKLCCKPQAHTCAQSGRSPILTSSSSRGGGARGGAGTFTSSYPLYTLRRRYVGCAGSTCGRAADVAVQDVQAVHVADIGCIYSTMDRA